MSVKNVLVLYCDIPHKNEQRAISSFAISDRFTGATIEVEACKAHSRHVLALFAAGRKVAVATTVDKLGQNGPLVKKTRPGPALGDYPCKVRGCAKRLTTGTSLESHYRWHVRNGERVPATSKAASWKPPRKLKVVARKSKKR